MDNAPTMFARFAHCHRCGRLNLDNGNGVRCLCDSLTADGRDLTAAERASVHRALRAGRTHST